MNIIDLFIKRMIRDFPEEYRDCYSIRKDKGFHVVRLRHHYAPYEILISYERIEDESYSEIWLDIKRALEEYGS